MEKIKMGNPRMKKRARTIKETNEVVLTNKMKGKMMELSAYKQDWAWTCSHTTMHPSVGFVGGKRKNKELCATECATFPSMGTF